MQTFKQFLAESRTQVVDVEAFIKWADANASAYLGGPYFLYRGGSGTAAKGLRMGNAAKAGRPRESANTYNNYTLWIDNHPSFKAWPKRSLSWIATDDREVAENFGGAALLVIDDSAQVGIVGKGDLWETDLPVKNSRLVVTIEELNGITQQMLGEKYSKTYEELASALRAHTIEDVEEHLTDKEYYSVMIEAIHDTMEKNGCENMFELWEYAVSPDIFTGNTTGAKVGNKSTDGEVWIEGMVGFVPNYNRLSEADNARLIDWAKKYPEFLRELHDAHWSGEPDENWGDD